MGNGREGATTDETPSRGCLPCTAPEPIQRCLANEKVAKACWWLSNNTLLVATAVGVLLGLIVGAALRGSYLSDDALMFIGFPGELFLRALKMLVLPLIISSVVAGTTTLDPKTNGRIALIVVAYFIVTSLISAAIGVVLVVVIHPGHKGIKENVGEGTEDISVKMLDTFMDLFRNALPENVMEACLKQVQTKYVWVPELVINKTNPTIVETVGLKLTRQFVSRTQMNALGLIVFFMCFGATLTGMGQAGEIMVEYFVILDKIVMRIVKILIWLTPIGVASLICERMASLAHLDDVVAQLGRYIATVLIGLTIHQFMLLPLLYFVIIRKNPFHFWWNVFQAFLTGFATESSAAALPITIQCMEEKNSADPRLTRFILPIGATINMNGTAMFVAIASIFIAQMNDLDPTPAQIVTIIFTATAVSVASSATPSASLFLMVMTLSVMPEVPISDVSLLFAIDWFLGRCRTTNNILGDCYAVAVMQHLYAKDLTAVRRKSLFVYTSKTEGYDKDDKPTTSAVI